MNTLVLFHVFQEKEVQFSQFYSSSNCVFKKKKNTVRFPPELFLSIGFSDTLPACALHTFYNFYSFYDFYLGSYEFTLISLIK